MLNSQEIEKVSSKATSLLFSSLELEESMNKTFAYLCDYFPLNSMFMSFNEYETRRVFLLCYTDHNSTLPTMSYVEFDEQQKRCEKRYNFVYKKNDYIILNKDDPRYILFQNKKYSFQTSTPLLSHKGYTSKLGGGAGNFCFNSLVTIPEDALAVLDNLRLSFHIFIVLHYRLWLLEQKNIEYSKEIAVLKNKIFDFEEFGIIGSSNGLQEVMKTVRQIAPLEVTVLIQGSTGTGKEMLAKALHALSPRRNAPFIAVNCGAIPPSLIDGELFGYNKGSFTGANNSHKGFFEQANQGTVFLDEIGDLPHEAQTRLLRVIQEHTVQRIGSNESINLDFRLLAASHKDLKQLVDQGLFREDLFYRLSVITIKVPDLKERKQDIPQLAKYFLQKHAKRLNIPEPVLKQSEIDKLLAHDWRGNVREFENIIIEALALSTAKDFNIRIHKAQAADSFRTLFKQEKLPAYDEMLRNYLTKALELCSGKIQGKNSASELLNLHPNTLRKKLDKYNIAYKKKFTP